MAASRGAVQLVADAADAIKELPGALQQPAATPSAASPPQQARGAEAEVEHLRAQLGGVSAQSIDRDLQQALKKTRRSTQPAAATAGVEGASGGGDTSDEDPT